MQYTSNYNLITVEGTDVVNPLVQMNPNFTDIDAAMFANKQSVIGSATEIATGTVHAITRANTDSNYFRFTATSNWTLGDSMSVDGVNVSVFLSDGTLPGTGAYVINTEVLALLSGSRVTLLTSSGSITVTASDVSYDNTGSGLAASDVQDAIDEVVSMTYGNGGSVTITGDGVMTYSQALDALYALVDQSKIKPKSYFVYDNNAVCPITNLTSTALVFSANVSATRAQMFTLKPSASTWFTYNFAASAYSDESANTIPSGRTLRVFY